MSSGLPSVVTVLNYQENGKKITGRDFQLTQFTFLPFVLVWKCSEAVYYQLLDTQFYSLCKYFLFKYKYVHTCMCFLKYILFQFINNILRFVLLGKVTSLQRDVHSFFC